jgi:hypothetical protein
MKKKSQRSTHYLWGCGPSLTIAAWPGDQKDHPVWQEHYDGFPEEIVAQGQAQGQKTADIV